MKQKRIYGVVSEFADPTSLLQSAQKLNKLGYRRMDAHSPFPIHGMEKALKIPDSKLGWIVFCFALLGFCTAITLQLWVATKGYATTVSGKPYASIEAFVPITFELTILFSAFSTVFGMFALNKLPLFYHPWFGAKRFSEKANDDGFFISIEAKDIQFDLEETSRFLKEIGAIDIEIVEA